MIPSYPSVGDTFTRNGRLYTFDGVKWTVGAVPVDPTPEYLTRAQVETLVSQSTQSLESRVIDRTRANTFIGLVDFADTVNFRKPPTLNGEPLISTDSY